MQGTKWKLGYQILVIIQTGGDGDSDNVSRYGGGRKWWNSGHLLNVEPTGVTYGLDVQYLMKEREQMKNWYEQLGG